MKFSKGNVRAGKLTASQVLELRELYAGGWSQGRLSRTFGISIGQIGRIVRGEAWQQYAQIAGEKELSAEAHKAMPQSEMESSLKKLAGMLEGDRQPPSPITKYDEVLREPERALEKLKRDIEKVKNDPLEGLVGEGK